ncbi:MAG: hypothetical protein SW833_11380 [Cyanobacteriota bacterium]|nr:hypothetical protein [Cyanobacteriota bacterium]
MPSPSGEYQYLYGTVGQDGEPILGKEGFTCRYLREGLYVLEFERPFQDMPGVTATVYGHEWQTFNMSIAIVDLSPHYAVLVTSTPDRPQSVGFSFIAFGKL